MITWTECGNCEELFCNWHRQHVADCACPAIDDWAELNLSPYDDETPADIAEVMQRELEF